MPLGTVSPDHDYASEPSEVATAYRVTLWEQPARPPDIDRLRMGGSPYPGAPMGWEQMTFDLVGAQDVPGSDPVGGRDARL
jgi:hypothetical protein